MNIAVLRNYSGREPLRSIFDEGGGFHGMMSCMLRIVAGVASVICDSLRWLWLILRSTSAVAAENLFPETPRSNKDVVNPTLIAD